jgi:hypothetical protein
LTLFAVAWGATSDRILLLVKKKMRKRKNEEMKK